VIEADEWGFGKQFEETTFLILVLAFNCVTAIPLWSPGIKETIRITIELAYGRYFLTSKAWSLDSNCCCRLPSSTRTGALS